MFNISRVFFCENLRPSADDSLSVDIACCLSIGVDRICYLPSTIYFLLPGIGRKSCADLLGQVWLKPHPRFPGFRPGVPGLQPPATQARRALRGMRGFRRASQNPSLTRQGRTDSRARSLASVHPLLAPVQIAFSAIQQLEKKLRPPYLFHHIPRPNSPQTPYTKRHNIKNERPAVWNSFGIVKFGTRFQHPRLAGQSAGGPVLRHLELATARQRFMQGMRRKNKNPGALGRTPDRPSIRRHRQTPHHAGA